MVGHTRLSGRTRYIAPVFDEAIGARLVCKARVELNPAARACDMFV